MIRIDRIEHVERRTVNYLF